MCGISLIIDTKSRGDLCAVVRCMNVAVKHRGYDGDNVHTEHNVGIGHRRLSIIDLTEKGSQPMLRNDVWITYNGEIYNYKELRAELEKLGHSFTSNSDTEVILAGWHQWGIESFKKMDGMWAFVIWDTRTHQIIICRDHFGIKPVVYTRCNGYFAAGSEIKQFLSIPGFKSKPNHAVIYNFLRSGLQNYSEDTFFDEVYSLPAGHYLSHDLKSHKTTINQWYNLKKNIVAVDCSFEEAKKTLYGFFSDSIKVRMRSDVKVGSCLSGGMDSSGIVMTIHDNKLNKNGFNAYTSCYPNSAFDEQEYADEVIARCGLISRKVYPNLNDLFEKDHLDKMIYHHEQPFSTASNYSEYKVFELAAEDGIKVLMDGQGADEYFWGYDLFFELRCLDLMKKGDFSAAYKLLRAKSEHHEKTVMETFLSIIRTNFYYPSIETAKKSIRKELPEWMNRKFFTGIKQYGFSQPARNSCEQESMRQMITTSLPSQLHSSDRNSMSHSMEVRTPYLAHSLVEFVMGLPPSFKINNGYSKYLLRHTLPNLPECVRWRKHKMGFPAPDRTWINTEQEKIRAELEEAARDSVFFNPNIVERYNSFIKGKIQYEPLYIRAISLKRFMRIFQME